MQLIYCSKPSLSPFKDTRKQKASSKKAREVNVPAKRDHNQLQNGLLAVGHYKRRLAFTQGVSVSR